MMTMYRLRYRHTVDIINIILHILSGLSGLNIFPTICFLYIRSGVCVFLILAIFAATTNALRIRHNLNGKIWISIRCKCGVFFKGLRISFSSMIFFLQSLYRAYLKFIQYKMLLMPYTIPICIFFQVLFLNLCLGCNVSHMFRFPTLFLLAQRKKKKPIWFVCYCCCYR